MSITKSKTYTQRMSLSCYEGDMKRSVNFSAPCSETITYDEGPKYERNGSCHWKNCTHVTSARRSSGSFISYVGDTRLGPCGGAFEPRTSPLILPADPPNLTQSEWDRLLRTCTDEIQSKLDLNCQDRVMSYSAVIDLVPLVGVATRLSSTLNRAARILMKRFGRTSIRRNIYEVIRLLISGDLINRFVIQTTIQDAHAVMTVFDRCLAAWQTANRRNMTETVLSSTSSIVTRDFTTTTTPLYYQFNWSDAGAVADVHKFSECTATVQVRGQFTYKLSEADPVRWVAHALGIDTPLESIWDKIPFSFVVDYFLRIGEFIERVGDMYGQDALRASIASISGVWAMTSCHSRADWTARDVWFNGYRFYNLSLTNDKYSVTGYRTFQRYPIIFRDASGFWDKGGLFDVQLSSVRKRTLLELAIQVGGGKSK